MHHKEFRRWKSSQLNRLLPDTATWKELRRQIPQTFASLAASQPPVEDFADLLEDLFRGSTVEPQRPDHLEEPPWTLEELTAAIKRLKCKRGADDAGLVIEILHCLLGLFNGMLLTGDIPKEWSKTLFMMLAKKNTGSAYLRLSAYCHGKVVVQNFFIHDLGPGRAHPGRSTA